MTVLVVLGILASIAVPRIDISGYRADAAMQSVGSALLVAQRAAVVRQHDVVVSFDASVGLIRIHEDADNDGRITPGERVRFEPLEDGINFGRGGAPAFRIGDGAISFTRKHEGHPAVTFRRNGSASEEGGFYLTTTRARSGGHAYDTRLVVVDRATGRTSWFHHTGSAWKQGF